MPKHAMYVHRHLCPKLRQSTIVRRRLQPAGLHHPGDQHEITVPGLFSPDLVDGRVQQEQPMSRVTSTLGKSVKAMLPWSFVQIWPVSCLDFKSEHGTYEYITNSYTVN